jgi:hypothetical protein
MYTWLYTLNICVDVMKYASVRPNICTPCIVKVFMNMQWLWPMLALLSLNEHPDILGCKTGSNTFKFCVLWYLNSFSAHLKRSTLCAYLPHAGENSRIGRSNCVTFITFPLSCRKVESCLIGSFFEPQPCYCFISNYHIVKKYDVSGSVIRNALPYCFICFI